MKKISLEKCLYYFDYDEQGNLYWKYINENCRNGKAILGSIASSFNKSTGYFQVRIEGKSYLQHRILYQLYHNIELNNEFIDHMNGIRSDNRKENLRIASRSENSMNKKVLKSNKSTGYKNIGIVKYKNYEYYRIQITKNGKYFYQKNFDMNIYSLEQIKNIRDIKLKEIHGEFHNLN